MPSQRLTRLIMDAIYFSGGASLADYRLRGLGAILMLHRVNPHRQSGFSPNSHLTVSPEFLELVFKNLSGSIYEFVSMDEVARRLLEAGSSANQQSSAKRPFIAVTLDDGYRDNLEYAVPVFRKYDVPFTIYIAPGLVDGRAALWWEDLEHLIQSRENLHLDMPRGRVEISLSTLKEKQAAFNELLAYFTNEVSEHEQRRQISELCHLHGLDPEAHRANSIMDWKTLRTLAGDPLCTLGAHTIGHYAVARLKPEEARYEMQESRRLVQLETGQAANHFAYPYGYPAAAGKRDFEIAREAGFTSAVTTRHGVCYPPHEKHMMALPRISMNGNFQQMRFVRTMLSGATGRIANRGAKLNIG